MNSSSKRDVLRRLDLIKSEIHNAETYICIIIPKTKKNIDRIITGKDLYSIVTNDKNGLSKVIFALDRRLTELSNESKLCKFTIDCFRDSCLI